jgi:hypothetical protein
METTIKDGTGTQQEAHVDGFARLHVFSVTEPEDKHIAREGKTWSYYFTTTPVGANDYFFYFENTGEETYTITDIRIMSASADTINVNGVSGTPSYTASADVDAVNRNRGLISILPSATAKKDTDTTGLTNNGTIFFIRCDTANEMEHLRTSSNIHIPKGAAVGLQAVTGTALITCIVSVSVLEQL